MEVIKVLGLTKKRKVQLEVIDKKKEIDYIKIIEESKKEKEGVENVMMDVCGSYDIDLFRNAMEQDIVETRHKYSDSVKKFFSKKVKEEIKAHNHITQIVEEIIKIYAYNTYSLSTRAFSRDLRLYSTIKPSHTLTLEIEQEINNFKLTLNVGDIKNVIMVSTVVLKKYQEKENDIKQFFERHGFDINFV